MIQGGSDAVTLPDTTEGKDKYFTAGYARHVLPSVGHFPTRRGSKSAGGGLSAILGVLPKLPVAAELPPLAVPD